VTCRVLVLLRTVDVRSLRQSWRALPEVHSDLDDLLSGLGRGWLRALVVLACAGLALFVIGTLWQLGMLLAPVLGLFFGGWLLACMIEPVTSALTQRTRLRLPLATGATYAAVAVVLVFGVLLIAPALGRQLDATVARLGPTSLAIAERSQDLEQAANGWLAARSLPVRLDVAAQLTPEGLLGEAQRGIQAASASTFAAISVVATVAGNLGLMLVLSVFFVAGGPRLAAQLEGPFSGRARADIHFLLTALHDTFGTYLRCQVMQGVVYGAGTWAFLSFGRVEGALLAAGAAGTLLLIPIVGPALALLVPALATVTWNPDATLLMLAALVVLQQLVLNGLGPRLMGHELGLPPLVVLFGVLVGAQLSGFWGAVFGVPVLAMLFATADHFWPAQRGPNAGSPRPTND
jgi:predicted PurR-regulated permease PerM